MANQSWLRHAGVTPAIRPRPLVLPVHHPQNILGAVPFSSVNQVGDDCQSHALHPDGPREWNLCWSRTPSTTAGTVRMNSNSSALFNERIRPSVPITSTSQDAAPQGILRRYARTPLSKTSNRCAQIIFTSSSFIRFHLPEDPFYISTSHIPQNINGMAAVMG